MKFGKVKFAIFLIIFSVAFGTLFQNCTNQSFETLSVSTSSLEQNQASSPPPDPATNEPPINETCLHPDTGAPVEDGTLYQFYTRSTGSTMECSMALVTSKCFGVEAVFKEPGGQVINQNTFANRYLSCNASPPPASNFEPHTSLTTLPPGMAKDLGEYRCSGPESAFMCTRITDFSGFTYDKKRHQFLMFGGGHATTFTDALMSLDMRASSPLTWKELYPPTPCSSMTIDNMDHNLGAWKSGPLGPYPRPYSRHTYDKLQVVGDEFIMLMTGTLRGGCAPSDFELFKTETFAHYNLNDAQWSFSEKSSRESPLTFGYDFPGTDVDPVSGNVIAVGRGGIWIYDIHSKKVTHVVSLNIEAMGIEGSLVYFPPNDKFYFFGHAYTDVTLVWEVTLNRADLSKSTVVKLASSGNPSPNRRGYAYSNHAQIIGGGVTGNRFFAFNPITKQWSNQVIQGASNLETAHHAFGYDPVNDVFVFLVGATYGHTWVYRY